MKIEILLFYWVLCSSNRMVEKMPVYYPRSNRSTDAVDLFIKSLIISGKQDTAMFYLKTIKIKCQMLT